MPKADNFQLVIWAVLNQQEQEQISRRTREALAAAKAKGVKLGGTEGSHASLAGMNAATYSYVAADSGGFAHGVLGQYTAKNLLQLVFEREMSKEEKILAQRKADAAASLEEWRNKRANGQD